MSTIKYKELRKRFEMDGSVKTVRHLTEALQKKELRGEDFSIRELAETLVPGGQYWVRELNPQSQSGNLLEGDGVDATAFLRIAQQIVYNKILETYEREMFAMSKLVETIPTQFNGEKIPGSCFNSTSLREVHDGMPYPNLGMSDDNVETPKTIKHGFIVALTKEAIFFDQTHFILRRAAEVGEILALNKEKRILDVVLGITNTYKWNGKGYATYCSGDPYINTMVSNPLLDWENLDKAESLFANMLDPSTKEPILIEPNTVLVMPQKRGTVQRLFHPNIFSYNVVSSHLAYKRLLDNGVTVTNAAEYWYLGNFRKAFAYMENWPITVTQSLPGSEMDEQDIVVRFKASERGTPAVLNPRYVVKCTA